MEEREFDVVLRSRVLGNTWSMVWITQTFADAEQKTLSMLQEHGMLETDEIIRIEKDYEWEVEK